MSIEKAIRSGPDRMMDTSIALWARLAEILFPLIGTHNFEYLFSHSLRLTQIRYDWMSRSRDTVRSRGAHFDLRACLAGDGVEGRILASVSLLDSFLDSLVGLLGEGLTEHVLDLAWVQPPRTKSQYFRRFFERSRSDSAR